MSSWLFWVGIVLGADALIGLLGVDWWAHRLPGIPIARIATAEAALAVVMLSLYLMMSLR